jgi:hypothetical protein
MTKLMIVSRNFEDAPKNRSINPLKPKINLNYISRSSSYRAVNPLRVGFKNQPIYFM